MKFDIFYICKSLMHCIIHEVKYRIVFSNLGMVLIKIFLNIFHNVSIMDNGAAWQHILHLG